MEIAVLIRRTHARANEISVVIMHLLIVDIRLFLCAFVMHATITVVPFAIQADKQQYAPFE